jgi:hypothetical protein
MKTLRLIKFSPAQNLASRYWEEDWFRRNDEVAVSDLTAEQQLIVAGALAWAVAQLPEGFEALESVELRKVADVVTSWTMPEDIEQPQIPLAYSPAFVAAIVGHGEHGERAIEIASVPGTVTDNMAILWEAMAQ